MIDVYGIGALNLDFIYEVAHLRDVVMPGVSLTPGSEIALGEEQLPAFRRAVERVGSLRKISPGGSASNTCHVLSLMGYRVGLVGGAGRDSAGDAYLGHVKGIDTGCVVRKGTTGVAYIINSEEKDRSIVLFPGSANELSDEDLNREKLAEARWLHMTSFVSRASLEAQIRLKQDLQGKARFSIDPGEIYAAMGSEVFPLIEGGDVLFTSKKEIELLFGCDQDQAIWQALDFAKIVVLKQGRGGASLFIKDFSSRATAEVVDAVDNTGAGDVLNGVFLGLLLRGVDPALALRVAVAAATVSVQGHGRGAYPDGERIKALYEDMLVHHRQG